MWHKWTQNKTDSCLPQWCGHNRVALGKKEKKIKNQQIVTTDESTVHLAYVLLEVSAVIMSNKLIESENLRRKGTQAVKLSRTYLHFILIICSLNYVVLHN